MLWLRMLLAAFRVAWPYALTPWRSPLVRWRVETFGLLDANGRLVTASAVDRRLFLRFLRTEAPRLVSFLRWAVRLPHA